MFDRVFRRRNRHDLYLPLGRILIITHRVCVEEEVYVYTDVAVPAIWLQSHMCGNTFGG